MSIPGLNRVRIFILALTILAVTCISSVALIDTVDQALPIFDKIEKWDAVQGLTAIAIMSILYSGFLAWQGFKKIGELEKTNREMIIKMGGRKCLLEERDYLEAVSDLKKQMRKDK